MAMAGPEAKGYDFSSIEILFSGGVLITPTIRKTLMKLPNVKDIIVVKKKSRIMEDSLRKLKIKGMNKSIKSFRFICRHMA